MKCNGILDGHYELGGKKFEIDGLVKDSIWQFRDMMPPVSDSSIVSLGEGWTPLIKAPEYGRLIGIESLWCKVEGQNPTGSFKDRAASLGLSLAKEWRKKGVFVASSGNAAAAVAAYSARAGIQCLVLIREDSTPSKLGQISMYGANLLRVRDIFKSEESLEYALNLTQRSLPDWLNHFIWASYNPLLVDGLKTLAYEIASDSGEDGIPDYVFVPTAGGDLLYGIYKGFAELKATGTVSKIPKMVVVQGKGANPIVAALEMGSSKVPQRESAETVAGALRSTFGAEHPLAAVRQSRGFGVVVTDEEILRAHRDVARLDGIFCEVSSATALAAIAKSIKEKKIEKDEKALAILTGFGFKDYYPPFKDISQVPLAESLDAIPNVLRSSYSN